MRARGALPEVLTGIARIKDGIFLIGIMIWGKPADADEPLNEPFPNVQVLL